MEISGWMIVVSIIVDVLVVSAPVLWLMLTAERRHDRDMTRIHDAYVRAIEAKVNVEAYGTPTIKLAVTEDVEPSPEERAQFEASAEMIERGGQELFELYAKAGIPATIEDCREEARAIANGVMNPNPVSMVSELRD